MFQGLAERSSASQKGKNVDSIFLLFDIFSYYRTNMSKWAYLHYIKWGNPAVWGPVLLLSTWCWWPGWTGRWCRSCCCRWRGTGRSAAPPPRCRPDPETATRPRTAETSSAGRSGSTDPVCSNIFQQKYSKLHPKGCVKKSSNLGILSQIRREGSK